MSQKDRPDRSNERDVTFEIPWKGSGREATTKGGNCRNINEFFTAGNTSIHVSVRSLVGERVGSDVSGDGGSRLTEMREFS